MESQIKEKLRKQIANLPDRPGVYFFLAKNKRPLYIGRATTLRDRVRSYSSSDLMEMRGPLLVDMIQKADGISWIETDSLLEAMILEANLIKKHQPKYNTKEKDQRSFNYVVVTREDYPRVLIRRGRALAEEKLKGSIYGPFPKADLLKRALAIIRKIFPFRDKCKPQQGKSCFNKQIGLCPGVCSGEITKTEYQKQIRRIKLFLSGKIKNLVKDLEREMRTFSKQHKFEAANELKKKIFALRHIQDVALIKEEVAKPITFRIEAYDVAHLAGTASVGVMVVWEDGQMKKSDYRKFTLRETPPGSDTAGLQEILKRRLRHFEWPLPDLLVLDGGEAQLNIARKVLEESKLKIPLVAVVKDMRHKPKKIIGERGLVFPREAEILLANSEAHRYAQSFHRATRGRAFRQF